MHICKWDIFLSWDIHPQSLILILINGQDSILCKLFLLHETESTDYVLVIPLIPF